MSGVTQHLYTSPNGLYQCVETTAPKNIQWIPTQNFGVPRGMPGRGGQAIKGVLIHCLGQSLEAYDSTVCEDYKLTKAKPAHPSLHYVVGNQGAIHQYVCDEDVAWGFQPYTGNFANNPFPDPNCPANWSLFTANPGINPDLYLIHIGIESGQAQTAGTCADCPTATHLDALAYGRLVHLLAWLAQEHGFTITKDAIQFDQNVRVCAEDECRCADIKCLVCDVDAYCQTCENPPQAEFALGNLQWLYGENKSRCTVRQPATGLLLSNLRVNSAAGNRLEVFDPVTNTWTPVPVV